MRRKEVLYAVVGGVVGAVLVIVAGSFSPLGAQSESKGSFDEITCRKIRVVSSDGKLAVLISSRYGGRVSVVGKDEEIKADMSIGEHGGSVSVFGNDGISGADMFVMERGGLVGVTGKNRSTNILNPE